MSNGPSKLINMHKEGPLGLVWIEGSLCKTLDLESFNLKLHFFKLRLVLVFVILKNDCPDRQTRRPNTQTN